MKLVDRDELLIEGYAVRSSNAAEADPTRAQLPGLWQRARMPTAFAGVSGRLDDRLYAVLTDYESDHRGSFTQIVGVAVADLVDLPEGLVAVRVPAARCLLLPARGPMPQALIAAWHRAWRHTDSGATPARSFTTDLEIHHADGADLYLATR